MSDDFVNLEIEGYTVSELIGQGASTKVYSATNDSNEVVAIKFLLHHDASYELFENNMEALSKLDHPQIVSIQAYGQFGEAFYIIMPHLHGGSVLDRLQNGALDPNDIVHILEDVCEALDYVHKRSILHRNLKPSNILLDTEGNAYVTGFDMPTYQQSHNITSVGNTNIGTPAYMPPEQIMGEAIDERSEVFAVGITSYELFTGKHPFIEERNHIKLMMKMMQEELPALKTDTLDEDMQNKVDAVIRRATAKKPDDRYASVKEFAAAMKSLFE